MLTKQFYDACFPALPALATDLDSLEYDHVDATSISAACASEIRAELGQAVLDQQIRLGDVHCVYAIPGGLIRVETTHQAGNWMAEWLQAWAREGTQVRAWERGNRSVWEVSHV